VARRAGSSAFKKFEANWWIEGNLLGDEQVVVAQGHSCKSLGQPREALKHAFVRSLRQALNS
jgi:hypothetical protein